MKINVSVYYNKAIDIVKSALINEDLRESYRKSRIELVTKIVQFNVKSKNKLYDYQYKDVSKLVSRFDDLIKIR